MSNIDSLIKYLRKQGSEKFVSAKELAELLGVTDRTVRLYIKKIKEENIFLIESTRTGYRLRKRLGDQDTSDSEYVSVGQRRFQILRKLLKFTRKGIDLFELSDVFYVSDATIRSDLAWLSNRAKKYELKIMQKGACYTLVGEERKKRDWMVDLIKEQSSQGASFKDDIQKFLGYLNLKKVIEISQLAFERNAFYTNTYFFQNFILHLALAIDRAKVGDKDSFEREGCLAAVTAYRQTKAKKVVDLICNELNSLFGLNIQVQDRLELIVLCYGEINQDSKLVKSYINKELEQTLDQVLAEISQVYLLDFSDQQFRQKLLYHVQNLYNRAQDHLISRNFSLLDIKVKYPVLFDIAVYMSALLAGGLEIEIDENEIAFLALHVGTFIQHQTEEEKQLQAIIVTPNYLHIGSIMVAKLRESFDTEIRVIQLYEDFSEVLALESVDLVLTTFSIESIPNAFLEVQSVVSVKEFMTSTDIKKIRLKTEQIYQKRYRMFLQRTLLQWIPEELYLQLSLDLKREELIQKISHVYVDNGYVEAHFKRELEEREKLSSTAFPSKVAIPHAIRYDALQTGLLVLKSSGILDWDEKEVQLVVALAVKKSDTSVFNRIFPRMMEVMAESYHVTYLSRSENRLDFIEKLVEILTTDGYYSL